MKASFIGSIANLAPGSTSKRSHGLVAKLEESPFFFFFSSHRKRCLPRFFQKNGRIDFGHPYVESQQNMGRTPFSQKFLIELL